MFCCYNIKELKKESLDLAQEDNYKAESNSMQVWFNRIQEMKSS